ncbi:HNH endonuclease [Pseudofrankia inefficax]|uniref:HNH endonuclease n=1 Tax=Pseudofrankia inefficax (strain DSM 45817 / CECT 9037 / DDB 130130 / EuI1c) TaxID=298654 RepID=E3IZX3_PSEI1|nr:HNH endonuclease [Pseudofrankia inefficax]
MSEMTAGTETLGCSGSSGPTATVETAPLPELEAELCGWAGRIAAATCRMLLVLAAFDRRNGWSGLGMASCAHWLAWRCGLSVRTAQEHVAVARALQELPSVRSAFAEGRLSYSKVRAVARVADAESDRCWLNHALHCTAGQLERLASRYHQLTADPAGQRNARRVSWKCGSDGMFRLSAVLTADEGARLAAAIDAARASLDDSSPRPAEGEPGSVPTDGEVLALPRDRRADADALAALADGFLSRPAPRLMAPLHTLTVHLDAETLLAPNDDPTEASLESDGGVAESAPSLVDRLARGLLRCDVEPGIGLPRAVLTRLGCDALVRGLLRDGDGSPLALGRRQRVPTARLRDAVYARDQGICQYPGCERTRWLHIHHLREWLADEGETDLENLTLLCSRHHGLVHDEGIRLERRDRRLVAVLSDGSIVLSSPALDPGNRPAEDLTAAVGHVPATAIHTQDGGRLSWDSSMLVLIQSRRPPEPPPTPGWAA